VSSADTRILKLRAVNSVDYKSMIDTRDQRQKPVYSIPEAAGYLRIPINTLYSWTLGRPKRDGGTYDPVLQHVDPHTNRLSFYDLVEAHILRAAVEKDVPLQHLRKGLQFLREKHPLNPRPLLTYDFMTDGKYLLVAGMLKPKSKDREALVNASGYGQLVIRGVVEPALEKLLTSLDEYVALIGRDRTKLPNTLFPRDGAKVISITSGVFSGRPVIEGTRIATSVVAQRFQAGEDIKALAKDYRIPKEKIAAAIKYEQAA
jgi:uncharacterized protein (DUF433 family)